MRKNTKMSRAARSGAARLQTQEEFETIDDSDLQDVAVLVDVGVDRIGQVAQGLVAVVDLKAAHAGPAGTELIGRPQDLPDAEVGVVGNTQRRAARADVDRRRSGAHRIDLETIFRGDVA